MSENFVAPGQQRYLRACMVCSIVMTSARFREEGCPNCEEFLHLQGSSDQIESCTSQVFEGLISLANPTRSWVAKWQRLDGYVKGIYAIKVSGQLPDDVRTTIEEEYRIQYVPLAHYEGVMAALRKQTSSPLRSFPMPAMKVRLKWSVFDELQVVY